MTSVPIGQVVAVLGHVGILLVAGAGVWWAGTLLSRDADALAESTRLGRVFIGAALLGLATSLPEIATTITAGVLDNPQLAIGNLMGGVAIQVVVLAVADVVESDEPLMFQVSRPAVLVQHVAVMLLLAVAIAGILAGEPLSVGGIGLWTPAIAVLFGLSLWLTQKLGAEEAWAVVGRQPQLGNASEDAGDSGDDTEETEQTSASRPPVWRLTGLALVILAAGWLVARSGDALATEGPLSGTFVGAALVALTTSLPEVSTVLGSLRAGNYDMAVANIVGTNGLEVALLVVADAAFRGGPILAHAALSDAFLAALALVLTGIYLGALLLRREETVLRVGPGSAAVILTYLGGMAIVATLD